MPLVVPSPTVRSVSLRSVPLSHETYLCISFFASPFLSLHHDRRTIIGALTPVDVVKTRIQLEPEVYNRVSLPCYPLYHHIARPLLTCPPSPRLVIEL